MNNVIVYKTTCMLNGKIYVGVHKNKSENPNEFDGYYGSGNIIKSAISKYGKENFERETLFVFDNFADAYTKEREIVNENFVLNKNTYNLSLGGVGCVCLHKTCYVITDEIRERMSVSAKERIKKFPNTLPYNRGRVYNEDALNNIRDGAKKRRGNIKISNGIDEIEIKPDVQIPDGWYRGRKENYIKFQYHTEESKKKIASNKKILGVSCYNNGVQNIKVPKGETPPEGFVKGMLVRTDPKMWVNNGIIEKTIPKNEEIEDGYIRGRIKKQNNQTS